MCAPSFTGELASIATGRAAADDLLALVGVPVAKALDLSTARGFDAAVARLAAELRRLAQEPETEAVRQAVGVLDIDWRQSTPAQRRELLARARTEAGHALASVARQIRAPLGRAATDVVTATRGHARRRHQLAIAADFNAIDRRAVEFVQRSTALFVRDALGQRVDQFAAKARAIVARGLEQGLGRDDIASELADAAEAALMTRGRPYWEVVAASFMGEGRSLAQVSAYAEAGIERYVLSAVLDEQTTDTCRFLDGKILETADALRTFDRLERADDPLALKALRPWVRERVGDDGRRGLVVDRGETSTVLAVVDRSGVGARDDRGAYSRAVSSRELAPAGIGFPPFVSSENARRKVRASTIASSRTRPRDACDRRTTTARGRPEFQPTENTNRRNPEGFRRLAVATPTGLEDAPQR